MKKMKKIKVTQLSILAVILLITTTLILSCDTESSSENNEYVYTTGKLSLNEYLNSNNNYESRNSNSEDIIIEAIFVSNIQIPENLEDDELNTFLEENSNSIEGTYTFKMNEEIIYSSEFTNGIETVSSVINTNQTNVLNRSGDCSYEGVRQCTIAKIDALSDFQKVVCAFRRGCVLIKVGQCIAENC